MTKGSEVPMAFRTGDSKKTAGPFRGGPLGAAPFSQVQILHLMRTEFARARRYGFPLACVLVRCDRIDALSDMHGAELRDKVRAELGRVVAESTRGADHLGMISEDRYLVLLPHTAETQAVAVAERIRRRFGELEVQVGGNPLQLSLSLGVAGGGDQETLFFDTLLSRAEAALGWASEAGGDRVETFVKGRLESE